MATAKAANRNKRNWSLVVVLNSLTIAALVSAFSPTADAQTFALHSPALFHHHSRSIGAILDLADDDFDVRQRAAKQLLERGTESWDWLYRAQHSSNSEIALSSSRLLSQIPFDHLLAKHVCSLADYQAGNFSRRARTIIRLGRVLGGDEQSVLAMLARFESDEVLSCRAAIELIVGGQKPIENITEVVGTSSRTACQWLRANSRAANHPRDFVSIWQPVINELTHDIKAKEQPLATCRLLRWYVEQLLSRRENDLADSVMAEIVKRIENRPEDVIETFDWLLLHQQHVACESLVTRFNDLISKDPRLVYRHAELERANGDLQKAEAIVAKIKTQNDGNPLNQLQLAVNLQLSGLDFWAARVMSDIAADKDTDSSLRTQAGTLLAELLFQQGQFEQARDTLHLAMSYSKPDHSGNDMAVALQNVQQTNSRYHYFAHLAAVEAGDWSTAEQHLCTGLEISPNQNDLLIALLRFPVTQFSSVQSGDEWRANAVLLINLALEGRAETIELLRVQIDKDARHARLRNEELISELNSYAWLASQTGVSLTRAEGFAREAFELSPGNCQVLDTLAACLFSQLRLEEAIAFQQRALNSAPWSRQIRSGLIRYRSAMMLSEMPTLFR